MIVLIPDCIFFCRTLNLFSIKVLLYSKKNSDRSRNSLSLMFTTKVNQLFYFSK